jgi:hypothetical protein
MWALPNMLNFAMIPVRSQGFALIAGNRSFHFTSRPGPMQFIRVLKIHERKRNPTGVEC